ncbi:MAG: protein-tyrosine phosphatase family protein [Terrimicrobiaceae bacterium]
MPYPTTENISLIPFPLYQGIFCLADEETDYDAGPLRKLGCVYLEDLSSGGNPADPVGEGMVTIRVIRLLVAELLAGRGVVVHCWGGIGRSGFITAGVLVALGRTPDEATRIVDRATSKAGLGSWPESGWQRRFLSHLLKVDLGATKEES